jgi:hypothetical protein
VKALAKAAAVGMRGRSRESVRLGNGSPRPKTFSREAQNRASRRRGLRFCGVLAPHQGRCLRDEVLESVRGDLVEESLDPTTGQDPLTDRVVKGRGDGGGDRLPLRAGGEVESRLLLALLGPAIRLAAGAVPKHERAAEN